MLGFLVELVKNLYHFFPFLINKYWIKVILVDCSNTGFVSFNISLMVPSNSSGEQRPVVSDSSEGSFEPVKC